MQKRLIPLLLMFAMLFTITSCEKSDGKKANSDESGTPTTPANPESDEQPTEPVDDVPYTPYVAADHEMRVLPSTELVKEFKTGWNAGNSLDTRAPGINAEKSWGNPQITFALIQAVSDAGFDAVRLPVTWGKHIGEAPDYTIDEEWLNRVEEVVGYVLSSDMYCIINTHHEEWYFPSAENEQQNGEQLKAIWEQLSERFSQYNEKLIFEGMNEPRLRDTEEEWTGGNPEAREIINRHNAIFIDTVRASGGNNANRHLMVPTYGANAEQEPLETTAEALLANYSEDDKLIVSIHAYIPNSFALNADGGAAWKEGTQHQWDIDWMFGRLKDHFLDNGIPVIIGETGAVDKNNLEERVKWTKHYFNEAREYGIPCFWWDNGGFYVDNKPAYGFGIMDRWNAAVKIPEIVDAIMGE